MNKKWLSVIVVGILIIIVVLLLGKVKVGSPNPTTTPINKIENFPSNQSPKEFPAQLPIEANAKIISNYNATSPDGQLQSTKVFLSSKSVQSNFELYSNYLTKNGWKILTKDSSKSDQQVILAQNSSGILNITIYKATAGSTVDLSYLPVR